MIIVHLYCRMFVYLNKFNNYACVRSKCIIYPGAITTESILRNLGREFPWKCQTILKNLYRQSIKVYFFIIKIVFHREIVLSNPMIWSWSLCVWIEVLKRFHSMCCVFFLILSWYIIYFFNSMGIFVASYLVNIKTLLVSSTPNDGLYMCYVP